MSKQFVFYDIKHTFVVKLNRRIMKKILTLLMTLAIFTSVSAQFNEGEWRLSAGLNAINDLDSQNPFNSPDEWIFNSIPLAVGVEYAIDSDFVIELMGTFNKFNNDDLGVEAGPLEKKFFYFSSDASLKYNWGQLLLPRRNRLELTANAGVGFYRVEDTNMTFNVGGGALWWLTDDKNVGLRAQTLAKFGKKEDINQDFIGNNRHFQWHLQAVFVLD